MAENETPVNGHATRNERIKDSVVRKFIHVFKQGKVIDEDLKTQVRMDSAVKQLDLALKKLESQLMT